MGVYYRPNSLDNIQVLKLCISRTALSYLSGHSDCLSV